jgi:predicted DNA-binding transcriptional regulator AlpA
VRIVSATNQKHNLNKIATAALTQADLDLVTRRDVAAALGVNERTLYRMEKGRTGPPRIKLNKKVFFRLSAVREWLARVESEGGLKPARKSRRARRAA